MSDTNNDAQAAVSAAVNVPEGWYPDLTDPQRRLRWWDGQQWTGHFVNEQVPATRHAAGPLTGADLNVNREVYYNRQQKGHSLILHLLFGGFVLWIPTIYFAASPNHYFHA